MEMIENTIFLPEVDHYYEIIPDDVWGDMVDRAYDDMVFDRIMEKQKGENNG